MPARPGRGRWALLLMLAMGLALAPLAWAGGGAAKRPDTVESLRQDLDRLRIVYTDDHPDVIQAKRLLERALKEQRERQAQQPERPVGQGDQGR